MDCFSPYFSKKSYWKNPSFYLMKWMLFGIGAHHNASITYSEFKKTMGAVLVEAIRELLLCNY